MAAAAPTTAPAPTLNKLIRIKRETVEIKVVGTMPLIVHAWSQKAKGIMLDAQQGKKRAKEHKDPNADYEASMYRLEDGGHGFPAVGFKAATVDSARYFQGVKMTELKAGMLFHGEGPDQLVRIIGKPQMVEHTVRVGMGTADIRYRAMYEEWSAVLRITYVPALMDLETLTTLVDAGGAGGVGEWRPSKSKTGSYGTYQVEDGS